MFVSAGAMEMVADGRGVEGWTNCSMEFDHGSTDCQVRFDDHGALTLMKNPFLG